jgi:asparagine synthase (glutamine-hydrolysing)
MPPIARLADAWGLLRHAGPGWVAYRAGYGLGRRLGWLEHRMPAAEWSRWSLARVAPGMTADRLAAALEDASARFFVSPARRERSRAALERIVPAAARHAVVDELAETRHGAQRFFSGDPVAVGWPPAWHRHPATGEEWPRVHWTRLPDFGPTDVKWLWELGRFGIAWTAVRAWWLTGDDRHAVTFWDLVESWRSANPPNRGVHWMCGQECALRALAWCFGLFGLLDAPATTPERVTTLVEMLAAHGDRIEANLGYAVSQKNNHAINEALGLWTIGTVFPFLAAARRWEAKGRDVLEREAVRQVYDDGAYVQHSVNYHRLVLQSYAWALTLGRLAGRPFSAGVVERYRRCARLLGQLVDGTSGHAPNHGANDGALLFRLDGCDFRDHRPSLALASWVAERRRVLPAGPWDELAWWLCGDEAAAAAIDPVPGHDVAAETGGYYTLRGLETWGFMRCCAYRDRPAQADLLHVDLWWRGTNVVADPGTFAYTGVRPWDNGLAGTDAHNAVTVDGIDQMRRGPRFVWFGWPTGRVLHHGRIGDGVKLIEAEHDGYRGRTGVMHRRALLLAGDRLWVVVDDVLGAGSHDVSSHWLFPGAKATDSARGALYLDTPAGPCSIETFTLRARGGVDRPRRELVHGDPDTTRGWCAFRYGHREPALSVIVSERAPLPSRRLTLIGLGIDLEVQDVGMSSLEVSVPGGHLHATLRPLPYPADDLLVAAAGFVGRPGVAVSVRYGDAAKRGDGD